jgi:hypothetical protein
MVLPAMGGAHPQRSYKSTMNSPGSVLNKVFGRTISDLKEFLKYLASAWGLLSAFTPLFPLFTNLSNLMPPPKTYPGLFLLLASLCSIFAVFDSFTHRDLRRKSASSDFALFFYAVLVTLTYLIVLPALPQTPIEQQLGLVGIVPFAQFIFNILRAMATAVEPLLYILAFLLFTQAFTASAVREWRKREGSPRR